MATLHDVVCVEGRRGIPFVGKNIKTICSLPSREEAEEAAARLRGGSEKMFRLHLRR